jgi:hypothetical protein
VQFTYEFRHQSDGNGTSMCPIPLPPSASLSLLLSLSLSLKQQVGNAAPARITHEQLQLASNSLSLSQAAGRQCSTDNTRAVATFKQALKQGGAAQATAYGASSGKQVWWHWSSAHGRSTRKGSNASKLQWQASRRVGARSHSASTHMKDAIVLET